jgi:outer membrane protein assembly factor BamB
MADRRPAAMHRAILVMLVAAGLAGCGEGSWFGGESKKKLEGDRVAVILQQDRVVEADQRLAAVPVKLPPQIANADWPQPGGYLGEFIPHPAADGFNVLWRTSVGTGAGRDGQIAASPVVAQGRVYVMDASSRLSAIDAAKGRTLWTFDVQPEDDRSGGGSGGGAAYDQGKVYVATGYAQVLALDAESGKLLWRTTLTAPFRAGPTVGNGRVFAVSADNQIHALDAATGKKMWSTSGIAESAGLYGGASPVLAGNTVIAALTSGEIFAVRPDNGRVLWSDSLGGIQRSDAVSGLANVRGYPIVDKGQVIVASHASRLADIDLRSGARIWEQGFGSYNSPWVAGDFIFMMTVDAELLCLSRRDGRVRWVQHLDLFKNPEKKTGRIVWIGPILAGGRLFATSSEGKAIIANPENGEILSTMSLPGPVSVLPVVAGNTVFVLTDTAELLALR